MNRWAWSLLIVGICGCQAYLWLTTYSLGISDEWVWQRVPAEPDASWNLIGITVAGALYAAFVEIGARRLGKAQLRRPALEAFTWLCGLVAVSFVWLWIVQESAPIRNRLGKAAFVLFYPGSSGYFTKARYEDPDPVRFLSGYEELMRGSNERKRDVLHVGTHPPGLFLVFHGLIEASQSSTVAAFLDATQPQSFREACDIVARNSARSTTPLLTADRRVLWLATLLVLSSASLAVVPLFHLVRRTQDVATAWRAAAMWPAIPALAIFTPKSDVTYAFVGLLIVSAWLSALDRRSVLLASLTGLLVWCGLMLSLAFLPVILFMIIVGWRSSPTEDSSKDAPANRWQQLLAGAPPLRCLFGAAAGFLVPTLLVWWNYRLNMAVVWWLNYQNHAAFYARYTRTYWQWLLVNPVELVFAAGWPLALLAASCLIVLIRSRRLIDSPVAVAVIVVWGSLWLTGKNSGEAARLWIVFLPWLVWLAGTQLSAYDANGSRRKVHPSTIVLIAQLIACALTVTRVSGFDFPQQAVTAKNQSTGRY